MRCCGRRRLTKVSEALNTLTIGDLTVRDQTFYMLDIPSDSGTPEMIVGWSDAPLRRAQL